MTPEQAEIAIQSKFYMSWGAETQVVFDNQEEEVPGDEYVKLTVQPNIGGQASLGEYGDRLYRQQGIVAVSIYIKQGVGTNRANELCKKARDIFLNDIDGVRFYNQSLTQVGVAGSYYLRNVTASYEYDEIL